MKKFVSYFIIAIAIFACESDEQHTVLPQVQVNETLNLSNPEFINLQVAGGWAYASGGIGGLIVYNLNGNTFKVWERSCPHLKPSTCTRMTVENSFKMKCHCDQSEFNILNGFPLTSGINYAAREYKAVLINSTTLKITNF